MVTPVVRTGASPRAAVEREATSCRRSCPIELWIPVPPLERSSCRLAMTCASAEFLSEQSLQHDAIRTPYPVEMSPFSFSDGKGAMSFLCSKLPRHVKFSYISPWTRPHTLDLIPWSTLMVVEDFRWPPSPWRLVVESRTGLRAEERICRPRAPALSRSALTSSIMTPSLLRWKSVALRRYSRS